VPRSGEGAFEVVTEVAEGGVCAPLADEERLEY
jgi:hypothetical protein